MGGAQGQSPGCGCPHLEQQHRAGDRGPPGPPLHPAGSRTPANIAWAGPSLRGGTWLHPKTVNSPRPGGSGKGGAQEEISTGLKRELPAGTVVGDRSSWWPGVLPETFAFLCHSWSPREPSPGSSDGGCV